MGTVLAWIRATYWATRSVLTQEQTILAAQARIEAKLDSFLAYLGQADKLRKDLKASTDALDAATAANQRKE